MKKYNVGIIGYGWAAEAHIPAINAGPLAQVTAVCSSRQLDPAALSARHGAPSRSITTSPLCSPIRGFMRFRLSDQQPGFRSL